MSVQNLPDSVLHELTMKNNQLFLAGLRHTLIDVELVGLIMDLGMLAVHAEIERRHQEQMRAAHIDEVLQTVVEQVHVDTVNDTIVFEPMAEVTDLGALDLPDEPF